jgi:hypothetical protein
MASRAAGAGTVPVPGKTLLILLRREIRFGLSRLIRAWPARNAAIRPRLTGYGSSRGSALRSCERRSALAPRQTAGSLFHCSVSPPRRGFRWSSQATATLAKRPAAYRGNRSRRNLPRRGRRPHDCKSCFCVDDGLSFLKLDARSLARRGPRDLPGIRVAGPCSARSICTDRLRTRSGRVSVCRSRRRRRRPPGRRGSALRRGRRTAERATSRTP